MRGWTRRNGQPAFTLLEVIGVVALLAILATLLTPALIQSMDQAAKARDASELKSIADAFQSAIRRHAQIPAPVDMPAFIAAEMGVAPSQVITNSRNVRRLFLTDPQLSIPGGLAYDQSKNPIGINIISSANHLRLLIFSSLSAPIPSGIDFDTAWATPDSTTPADWISWPGEPTDLTIQRLDLTPLFHRLILNPAAGTTPSFSIENDGVPSVPPITVTAIHDSWYLDKTVLRLFYATGGLEFKAVISDDASYFYDSTTFWMGSLK
jgi:type II secretory pathway pseudopilin PulG